MDDDTEQAALAQLDNEMRRLDEELKALRKETQESANGQKSRMPRLDSYIKRRRLDGTGQD